MNKAKKVMLVSLAAILVSAGMAASVASAKTSTKSKSLSGKVTSISSSSLDLKVGSKTYTINESSSTTITDKKSKTISFKDIKKNDKVKATGTLTSKTMDATKIVDKSKTK